MVDLTFRTIGAWGGGKGSNLEPSEVDSNFWSLANAIFALQNDPALPVGIASIVVAGTQMTITLTDGSTMGPYTLPVLTMRWRGEFESNAPYESLDVFTVSSDNTAVNPATVRYGIFLVQVSGLWAVFEPDLIVDGNPAFKQLFGSVDTKLSTLSDVQISGSLTDGEVLEWVVADEKWENILLGDMSKQNSNNVTILGGVITGMPTPASPDDVATKAYVDSLPAGMTSPDKTMMANISGVSGPAIPHLLSDFLDYALGSSVRGTLLYRGGVGWQAFAPGTAGQFLKTMGAGVDPIWDVGGSGVVSITAGAGISTGGAPITSTGTVALAVAADSTVLANVSGASTAPVPTTLSAWLDHAASASRGTILTRTAAGWVALAPGTSGLFLKTQGPTGDAIWDAPAGSGTVTSVASGTGLTGGPVTSTGTLSLAAIPTGDLLANTSGSSAAPVPMTVTLLFDAVFGATQGAVLYRSASAWVLLAPGTSGQFLTTGGAAANPSWQNAPITGASTPNLRIVSNISGAAAVPTGNTLSNILDAIISSSRGTLLYRTNTQWQGLPPGASGQVLQTGGVGGDPSWATNAGGNIAITTPHAQDILSYNSSSGRFENVRPRYVVGAYVPGRISAASQSLLYHKFSKAVTVPANLGAYLGHTTEAGGGIAATSSTAITLERALAGAPTTFSTVASVTFAGGSVTGTMSIQAAIAFAQGDVLRIRGPATPDVTFADFHLSLVGFET
jgi:hypothetical protein